MMENEQYLESISFWKNPNNGVEVKIAEVGQSTLYVKIIGNDESDYVKANKREFLQKFKPII